MNDPLALTVADPLAGWVLEVTVRVSPSGSVSFPNTPGAAIDKVTSSLVVYELLTAVGARLTLLTVMVTVAVSVPPLPSEMV